jgi:hypothetical protein
MGAMEELDEFLAVAKNIIDSLEKGTTDEVWARDIKTLAADTGDLIKHASLDLQNSKQYRELKTLHECLQTLIALHIELFYSESSAGHRFS